MDAVYTIIAGACGAAIVNGLFGIIMWRLNRKAKKEDLAVDKELASCDERGREIKELQDSVRALMVADRTILYDRIKYLAKTYIKRGWISVEEYEDLKRMHEVYHDVLDGNGFLDSIMAEVDQLDKRVL